MKKSKLTKENNYTKNAGRNESRLTADRLSGKPQKHFNLQVIAEQN